MTIPRFYVTHCPTHRGIVTPEPRPTHCPVCHQALKPLPRANLRGGIGDVLGRLAKQRERARGQARAERSQRKLREEKEKS